MIRFFLQRKNRSNTPVAVGNGSPFYFNNKI